MQSPIYYNNAERAYRLSSTRTLGGTGDQTIAVFGITGNILVRKLYAVVTVGLSASHGHCRFQLNDQTATTNITAPHDTYFTLPAGSTLEKTALAATILNVTPNNVGVFEEGSANISYYQEFKVTQKTGAVRTDIEYFYNTIDNPDSGTIQFFIVWVPVSANAAVEEA